MAGPDALAEAESTLAMIRKPRLAAVLTLLAALMAGASRAEAAREPAPASAPRTVSSDATPRLNAHPGLWKITRGATTIYLFGTVHLLPKAIVWYGGPIAKAFDGASELVTEVLDANPEDMKPLLAAKAFLPAGQSLDSLLAPGDRARLNRAAAANGLDPAMIDRFQPWYAAIALATLPAMHSGLDAADGADTQLAARAKAAGRAHVALETVTFQLGVFASLPRAAQLHYLHQVLVTLPQVKSELAEAVKAWAMGDVDRLARLTNEDEGDPLLRQRLIIARNQSWAAWIRARLAEASRGTAKPQTLFIAVGAGHLAGAGSVIADLRAAGIRVTRVQ